VAYDDRLFEQFKVSFVPACIWIDDKGVLKAITTSAEVTDENVRAFISGNPIKMVIMSDISNPQIFDANRPLLLDGNGGNDSDFLFRSVLSHWNRKTSTYYQPFITSATDSKGRAFWSGV